jgi:hypothetical protein
VKAPSGLNGSSERRRKFARVGQDAGKRAAKREFGEEAVGGRARHIAQQRINLELAATRRRGEALDDRRG